MPSSLNDRFLSVRNRQPAEYVDEVSCLQATLARTAHHNEALEPNATSNLLLGSAHQHIPAVRVQCKIQRIRMGNIHFRNETIQCHLA